MLAGASGFLGQAWAAHLSAHDHEVVRLVRSEPTGPDESRWDPYAGTLDVSLIESLLLSETRRHGPAGRDRTSFPAPRA